MKYSTCAQATVRALVLLPFLQGLHMVMKGGVVPIYMHQISTPSVCVRLRYFFIMELCISVMAAARCSELSSLDHHVWAALSISQRLRTQNGHCMRADTVCCARMHAPSKT